MSCVVVDCVLSAVFDDHVMADRVSLRHTVFGLDNVIFLSLKNSGVGRYCGAPEM